MMVLFVFYPFGRARHRSTCSISILIPPAVRLVQELLIRQHLQDGAGLATMATSRCHLRPLAIEATRVSWS